MNRIGITVFGCEHDEAECFVELSPRFGIMPTLTRAQVSETSVVGMPRNRCVSVGHKSAVTAPILRALGDAGVEHLSTRSIGVDHIDLDAARALDIAVDRAVYAPDGVADFTLMLILMAIRGVPHDFRVGAVRGRDLRDLTVGVVGVGNIGAAVADRLHGFGCRVLACSRRPLRAATATFVPLDDLLRVSDVVTLHVPLDATTHHLIGAEQLSVMKPGAVLVNTARGGLVDTDALVVALEHGRLGGAALDVVEGADGIFYRDGTAHAADHPSLLRLQRLPNVIVTPHTAYSTTRALHDTVEQTLRTASDFERNCTWNDRRSRCSSGAARKSTTSP